MTQLSAGHEQNSGEVRAGPLVALIRGVSACRAALAHPVAERETRVTQRVAASSACQEVPRCRRTCWWWAADSRGPWRLSGWRAEA